MFRFCGIRRRKINRISKQRPLKSEEYNKVTKLSKNSDASNLSFRLNVRGKKGERRDFSFKEISVFLTYCWSQDSPRFFIIKCIPMLEKTWTKPIWREFLSFGTNLFSA